MFKIFSIIVILASFAVVSFAEKISVNSLEKWNNGNSTYLTGTTFTITAAAESSWEDVNGKVKTDADGYPNVAGIPTRIKLGKLMQLCCCMNNNISTCEKIGSAGDLKAKEDGFVSCFANDNENTYGNNIGAIEVDISVKA